MRQLPVWKPVLLALVTLVALLYSLPSFFGSASWWPRWLPSQVVQQGLDLQGGLYLLLRVHVDKAVEQSAENLVDEVRGLLVRDKVPYKGVERTSQEAITLKLGEGAQADKVRESLGKELPILDITAPQPGVLLLTLTAKEQAQVRQFAVDQSIQTIRSRIDQFGVAEPTIQKQGEDRILVQLPGLKDPERAKALIGRTARLDFKMLDEKGDLAAALGGKIPPGDEVLYEEEADKGPNAVAGKITRKPYLVKKRTVMTGDLLTDARVNFDNRFNEPYVSITFNRKGARKFAQLTKEHVGERMAIVLDNKIYSAPVIREPIEGGRAQISGSFTTEEAHDLAIVLRAGALPAPVTIMEERTVGPTLGRDSIREGMISMLVGSGLVLLFMAWNYRAFGWVANIAVVVNILLLIAALAFLQATLTMPGIAGVVLLVGMSVDANVLINERIREELRNGKSPLAAIDAGYDKAFITILDSNLTTLITALILFQFGTGPVQGFAITLSLGLLASMFTAIFMTRVLVALFLRNRRIQRLSI